MSRRRRRPQSETGSALVELGLCTSLLFMLLWGTTDFVRVYYEVTELNNGARAGAQYGSLAPATSGDISGMQTVATNAVTITGASASASRLCQCATNSGIFSATTPANNCTLPPATACPSSGNRVITVTVTTSKTFSTIAGLAGLGPSFSLSRSATMRVPNN